MLSLSSSKSRARILTFTVGILSLALYCLTLHEGFFPGLSVRQISIAKGFEQNIVESRIDAPSPTANDSTAADLTAKSIMTKTDTNLRRVSLKYHTKFTAWRAVSRIAANLDIGALSKRMNLLSAICGAIAVALLFSISRTLLLMLSFEQSPVPMTRRKLAATLAGMAGALTLAVSAPFWIASTRCLPYSFEIMLFLTIGAFLVHATVTHRLWPIFLATLLMAFAAFEWDTGLRMLPLFIFFTWRAIIFGNIRMHTAWVVFFGGIIAGVLLYLALFFGVAADAGIPLAAPFKEFLYSLRLQMRVLLLFPSGNIFEHGEWFSSTCFAVLPFIATIALAMWQDEKHAVSGGLLLVVLGGVLLLSLSSVSIAPWKVFSKISYSELPCASYMLIAFVAAFLAGRGCLIAGGHVLVSPAALTKSTAAKESTLDTDSNEIAHSDDHLIGNILLWYTALVIVALGVMHFREVRDWKAPLINLVANTASAELLPDCRWLASDGELDSMIRLYAGLRGHNVHFLPAATSTEEDISRLRIAVARDPAFQGIDASELLSALNATNVADFAGLWIAADTNITQKLQITDARIWEKQGLLAIPKCYAFSGVSPKNFKQIDLNKTLETHRALWKEVAQIPPLGPQAPLWLRAKRAAMRNQICAVGEKLAQYFQVTGHKTTAAEIRDEIASILEDPLPKREVFENLY